MAATYKHKETNKKYRLSKYNDGREWLVGFLIDTTGKPTGYPRHFHPHEVEEVKTLNS